MAVDHWWFGFFIDQAEHDDLRPGFLAAAERATTTPEGNSGFDELALRFLGRDGDRSRFLEDGHLFRFVSTRQITPMSVVWQALGADRALMLPGQMGNLLLGPAEVAASRDQVSEAYAGLTTDVLFERALRYCAPSVFLEEDLRDAITFLPDGLRQARERGKGFLSLARTRF